ncbi:unnamed protein product [Cylindrotheca closterium]|uniref:Uncharacterized protein n=1 Tax=Cylindrotheca closterium TaxID=2856 RepID=A0AAD2CHZ5_9STRA|nr:unnamed protein product [Cylindrotheca closterium]
MVVDPPCRNPQRTNRRRPLRFAEGIAELRGQGERADNQEDAQAEAAPDINMDLVQGEGDDAGAGNNNIAAGEGNNNLWHHNNLRHHNSQRRNSNSQRRIPRDHTRTP